MQSVGVEPSGQVTQSRDVGRKARGGKPREMLSRMHKEAGPGRIIAPLLVMETR